jgi:hypothetical protein
MATPTIINIFRTANYSSLGVSQAPIQANFIASTIPTGAMGHDHDYCGQGVGAVEGKIIRADGGGDAARERFEALPSQRDSDFDAIRLGLYQYGWAALRETRRCRAQGERRCGKERDRIY